MTHEAAFPIRACLIANRGEIAVRIIRACRELGIRAGVVYAEADAGAAFVRLADAAHPLTGSAPADTYLNIPALIAAAHALGCDAVHPGYGFLSENADFAAAVIAAGLIWVGPPPDAMRTMGSKTAARAAMQAAGVPVVPGWQPPTDQPFDEAAFTQAAAALGFPLLVKASAGGGGRGIRRVDSAAELPGALAAAQREAGGAFGDARVFLEKLIAPAHHLEVQILADAHGNVIHLYERECSAQRRQQKVIEEAPSPLLERLLTTQPDLRDRLTHAAVTAARAVGYVNAGTVEFIMSPVTGDFYFLEMNTRLQVEHPVTEAITGLDLVRAQFAIAQGMALPWSQGAITRRGHAIEARLYAEDPRAGFAPSPGTLHRFSVPARPGLRVDAGFSAGDAIPLHYDALIAKLIVHAETRDAAIRRLTDALAETVVVGVTTGRPVLERLLADPAFAAGQVDTGWLDRHLAELLPPLPDPVVTLIAAALLDSGTALLTGVPVPTGGYQDPWLHADGFRIGGAT